MKKLLLTGTLLAILFSCNKEEALTQSQTKVPQTHMTEASYEKFGKALSQALTQSPQLARTLQAEALKMFDNNTDVLYHEVKSLKIEGEKTVEDLIRIHWSGDKAEYNTFVDNSPLLNIFASDLEVINQSLALNNWDLSKEIGVAIALNTGNKTLLVNGDSVATIHSGEIPTIPTFVINQNQRVKVKSSLRSLDQRVKYNYDFVHSAFDGSTRPQLRSQYVEEAPNSSNRLIERELDYEIIRAWEQTNGRDLHTQRAKIYYSGENGGLNYAFSEYLYRFKISTESYDNIAGATTEEDDPKINNERTTHQFKKLGINEVIEKIWTKGSFTFQFEVITPIASGYGENHKPIISVTPKELFIMNAEETERKVLFTSIYYYRINPEKIEGRWVYPEKIGIKSPLRVSGTWDLSQQGLSKMIKVSELDKGKTYTSTETFSTEFANSTKLSLSDIIKDILSIESSSSYKTTKTVSTTVSYTDKDDNLGTAILYFTDPVITRATRSMPIIFARSRKEYHPKDISTGSVTMTFLPMKYK